MILLKIWGISEALAAIAAHWQQCLAVALARALAAIWFAVLDTLKREYAFSNLYTSMTLDNSLYYVLIVYTRATKNKIFC